MNTILLALALAQQPPAAPAGSEPAAAAPTETSDLLVTTRLSPDPSRIGDLLELEITVAYPKGYTVNLPTGLSVAPLSLVETVEQDAEPTGEGFRKQFLVRMQHFEVGEATIPDLQLTYVDGAGAVQTLRVPGRAFQVESLLANEADPQRKGEEAPISIAYPNERAEVAIWTALASLTAAFALWVGVRRWQARRRPVFVPPPRPAHEVAREALDALERAALPDAGEFQAHYLQLTEIAKAYLEGRFRIEALDRTTEEIRRRLLREEPRIAPLRAADLIAFLHRCDLVKFARQQPSPEDARAALSYVREVVERTTAVAEPSPADRGAA